MITKQVPMNSIAKSDFGGLVKYLTDEQNKHERVGFVSVTNCHSDDWKVAVLEVLNTQAKNKRATSDKTYHLIVSFRAGEELDDATLKAIEKRLCDGLGYGEHQRVSVVHHDTDNLHFHIAINKIHPTRNTLHDPYKDYRTQAELCVKLEREFGLQIDNHAAQKTGSENRAEDMERHSGVESLLGWIKRECSEQILSAKSWAELHAVMRANSLEIQVKGNGFVITNGEGLGVKASSVARELSKSQLENRLGLFEPGQIAMPPAGSRSSTTQNAPPVAKVGTKPPPQSQNRLHTLNQLGAMHIDSGRRYQGNPMASRVDTVELYAKYKAEQLAVNYQRAEEWAKALARKNAAIEDARRTGRLKRAATKILKGAGRSKKLLYAATSTTMKADVQSANQRYLKERQEIYDKYQRRAWADWLKAKALVGDAEALTALRARTAATGVKGNTVAGQTPQQHASATNAAHDNITKKGTVIYRVGTTAVRDDGDKLKVSRGADRDGLEAALRMAIQRYGERIKVNGTAAFKEQVAQAAAAAKLPISFEDAALERRRQELLKSTTTKENQHDKGNPGQQQPGPATRTSTDGGRADSGSDGQHGHPATRVNNARAGSDIRTNGGKPIPSGGFASKPNIGGLGRKPPPESQNRLRNLSQLGLVQLASGSEVLLPGHVPGHVEHQGTKPDNGLRRNLSRPGLTEAAKAAMDKYIAEREAMRLKAFDIPKHKPYNSDDSGPFVYSGTRQVGDQKLALLMSAGEILVLPIDESSARRLGRLAIGEVVTVTSKGAIATKGRSR